MLDEGDAFAYWAGEDDLVVLQTDEPKYLDELVHAYVSESLAQMDSENSQQVERRKGAGKTGPIEEEKKESLPAGWEVRTDKRLGARYYYNKSRRIARWTTPVAEPWLDVSDETVKKLQHSPISSFKFQKVLHGTSVSVCVCVCVCVSPPLCYFPIINQLTDDMPLRSRQPAGNEGALFMASTPVGGQLVPVFLCLSGVSALKPFP